MLEASMDYALAREAMTIRVKRNILGLFFFIFIVKLRKSQVTIIFNFSNKEEKISHKIIKHSFVFRFSKTKLTNG